MRSMQRTDRPVLGRLSQPHGEFVGRVFFGCALVALIVSLIAAPSSAQPHQNPIRQTRPQPPSGFTADRQRQLHSTARVQTSQLDGRSDPQSQVPIQQPPVPNDRTVVDDPATPPTPIERVAVDAVQDAAQRLTVEKVSRREEAAAKDESLEPEAQPKLKELYADARSSLERAASMQRRAAALAEQAQTADRRSQERTEQERQLDASAPKPPSETDATSLEARLDEEHAELRKLKERKLQLDEQAATRVARRAEIRVRLSQLDQDIPGTKQAVGAASVSGESGPLALAKRTVALARLKAVLAEGPALKSELDQFNAESTANLLQLERSVNAKMIGYWSKQAELTADALQVARETSAGSALAEAVRDEQYVPEALRPIAEVSLQLAEDNQELIGKIKRADGRLESVVAQLDQLRKQFATTQTKVASVDELASVGAMLRNQRTNLPDSRILRMKVRERAVKVDEAQLQIFDLDEEVSRLVDLESATRNELQSLAGQGTADVNEKNLAIGKRLLSRRREVLDKLYRGQQSYFESLNNRSLAEGELARLADEFLAYIEERVLWIRSDPPLYTMLVRSDWDEEFTSTKHFADAPKVLAALTKDAQRRPILYFGTALIAGVLLALRLTFVGRLKRIAERARSSAYSHFSPSLTALLINGVSCLLEPLVLGFIGWRLINLSAGGVLGKSIGHACLAAAILLLPLSFFRRIFARHGLADAHFDWPTSSTNLLRRNLNWITTLLVPLVFVSTAAHHLQAPTSSGFLPHSLFFVACIMMAVFLWRLLHPDHGLPAAYLDANRGSWLERLRLLWFWGILAAPVAMAVLLIFGYAYTARELTWRGFQTVAIVGFLWILHALFMRLILVHRRKLSMDLARERYAEFQRKENELQATKDEATGAADAESLVAPKSLVAPSKRVIADLPGVSVTSDGIVVEEDPLADLRANTAQSRRLVTMAVIGVGLALTWLTWHNVLPALGFLEQWPLWNSSKEIAEQFTNEAGIRETRKIETVDPVTIADLVLAILVAAMGFIAARDLPGLLELAVLKRLPLERSIRYAITTLSSYGIVFVGLFVACRFIGLRWQQIQWVATALTFGLAFGLQEMFANFVAGVILLFERPIRVGDIVTIDEVSGVISKIRMRATTVTNWDRKDYIVPNKDFITGRLLNWTRSDRVSRIVVTIGAAYGSDTNLAKKLLTKVADDHPLVVSDPAPQAIFEEFGESALSLVLRCFISMENMPMRLDVVDQLNTGIDLAFRDAGIEIAFPQQDLWLRGVPAGLRDAARNE